MDVSGPPIRIINVPWDIPEDTWILDPICIKITYGAKNETGRMQLDVQDAKSSTVQMTASIHLSVRVLDGGGITRIASGES